MTLVPQPEHSHGGLVLDGTVRDIDAFAVCEGVVDERVGLDFRVREREVARDGRGGAVSRGRDEAVDDSSGCRVLSSAAAFAHLVDTRLSRLAFKCELVWRDLLEASRDLFPELVLGLLDGRPARQTRRHSFSLSLSPLTVRRSVTERASRPRNRLAPTSAALSSQRPLDCSD